MKRGQFLQYQSDIQEGEVPTTGTHTTLKWDEFLGEGERGYLVLGCMDRDHAFAIPTDGFRPLIEDLNTTRNEDGTYYWHIQLTETPSGDVSLLVPKRKNNLSLSEYVFELQAQLPTP